MRTSFLFLLAVTLLLACNRQGQAGLESIKANKDQEEALNRITKIAAKYNLEDSVSIFFQPGQSDVAVQNDLDIPNELAEAWMDEFFQKQRIAIDQATQLKSFREECKSLHSIQGYFDLLEKYPSVLQLHQEGVGGPDKFEAYKQERLTPDKYHIYLDNEGAIVWQPASKGNYQYGTRLDINN